MDAQAKYYKSCLTHVEDMLPDIRCMIGTFTHCYQCSVVSVQIGPWVVVEDFMNQSILDLRIHHRSHDHWRSESGLVYDSDPRCCDVNIHHRLNSNEIHTSHFPPYS